MASKNKAQVAEGFKKDTILSRNQKRLIFYILMISIPCIQFAMFYIYVNVNTIALAFQGYTKNLGPEGGYFVDFVGIDNFKEAWAVFSSTEGVEMILNSLYLYVGNLVIVLGMALVFSYYIAKKFMFAGFFRVVLYLPHVVSSVVLVIIYKYIVNDVVEEVLKVLFDDPEGKKMIREWGINKGLLGSKAPDWVKFATILVYNLWVGFGANVMLFTGSMSGIDQSIIESAHLDGVNIVQEFIHIYIPMIFPTFITFVVTGITAIFSNNMSMVTFFGTDLAKAPFKVFGYYMYANTNSGTKGESSYIYDGKSLTYPMLSALAIIITVILVPITLVVRKLLETYGPRTD